MKKLITSAVLVAFAIGLTACGSTTTNVYPTKTVYVPKSTGSSSSSRTKSRPSSYSSDPVRSGKINPGSVEPVRTPSTYTR